MLKLMGYGIVVAVYMGCVCAVGLFAVWMSKRGE